MSRPKMVSVPGGGGGGTGPRQSGACIPDPVRVSVRAPAGLKLAPRARCAPGRQSLGSRESEPVGAGAGAAGCAGRGGAGDRVPVGSDLAAELRVTQGPPPRGSPLPTAGESWPPDVQRRRSYRAWPHRGPAGSSWPVKVKEAPLASVYPPVF